MAAVPAQRKRLSGDERRSGIIAAATAVFAERGYGGTPTARIAAAAGCNETLLFRHFGSKRDLYLACIDAAWHGVRARCDDAIAGEPDPALHWRRMGAAFLGAATDEPEPARLWARALVETTGDEGIDDHLARIMTSVHDYAAGVLATSQRAGGVLPDRDPASEAWTMVAFALLGTVGERLGPAAQGDLAGVFTAHREWLTGASG